MNPKAYAKALMESTKEGLAIDVATKNFIKVLRKRGVMPLLPKIASELEKLESQDTAQRSTLTVARESDFTKALKLSDKDVTAVKRRIDKTLIGGYKLEQNGELTDTSYKSKLLDLYRKITN